MMCDVGTAAIKDAIANIARNREVLHFLSCIARFLGHFSGLATTRQSDFPEACRHRRRRILSRINRQLKLDLDVKPSSDEELEA